MKITLSCETEHHHVVLNPMSALYLECERKKERKSGRGKERKSVKERKIVKERVKKKEIRKCVKKERKSLKESLRKKK